MPMAIPERYNTGYSIGVGGAVVRDGRLLFVRRASRHGRGNWQLPGGFIEPDETIEQAVVREIQEEAGVTAEVEAVLGLRSRYDPDSGNGIYVILLLRPVSGEPRLMAMRSIKRVISASMRSANSSRCRRSIGKSLNASYRPIGVCCVPNRSPTSTAQSSHCSSVESSTGSFPAACWLNQLAIQPPSFPHALSGGSTRLTTGEF